MNRDMTFEELENEVMKLSPELRAELLTKLQHSLAEARESGTERPEDVGRKDEDDGSLWIGDLRVPIRSDIG